MPRQRHSFLRNWSESASELGVWVEKLEGYPVSERLQATDESVLDGASISVTVWSRGRLAAMKLSDLFPRYQATQKSESSS
jgi:hypothetical protein